MTISFDSNNSDLLLAKSKNKKWYKTAIFWISAPLILITSTCVFASLLPLSDPNNLDLSSTVLPPFFMHGGSMAHPLGTSNLGQDLLSELIFGGRTTIFIGLVGMLGGALPGILLGLVAGFSRGIVDTVIARLIDAQLSLPFILVALAVIASRGHSVGVILTVLALTTWPFFARVIRSEALSLRERPFVMSLRSAGVTRTRILLKHILPNLFGTVVVLSTLGIGAAILIESAIDFLGLGVTAPGLSWGSILASGQSQIGTAWWIAAWPGIMISVFVLLVNLLGDELISRFDPRYRNR